MRKGRTSRTRKKTARLQQTESGEPIKPQIKDLFKWASYNALDLHRCHFKPYMFPDTGRGMLARTKFNRDSLIISVPKHLLITTQYILNLYIGDTIKKYNITHLKPIQLLCMFLMCEKLKGCSSFWHPYIDSLPKVYTTPGFWSREELLQLPVWIRKEAEAQLQSIRESFNELSVLAKRLTATYPDLEAAVTYRSYLWAWNTVNTRAVYMKQPPVSYLCDQTKDNMVLAPVLDFLNHSAHVEVKAGFNEETECYEIHTVTPCKKHEQLFISYGPHDNTKLLLEYGFMVPNNPHSAVLFSMGNINQVAKDEKIEHLKEKVDIIDKNLINRNCICSLQGGVSWNLQCAVKLLVLDSKEMKQWRKILYEPCENPDLLRRSNRLLKSLLCIKEKLIVIPNFKEPLNFHKEMITRLCEEQKDILEYCIGTVT